MAKLRFTKRNPNATFNELDGTKMGSAQKIVSGRRNPRLRHIGDSDGTVQRKKVSDAELESGVNKVTRETTDKNRKSPNESTLGGKP